MFTFLLGTGFLIGIALGAVGLAVGYIAPEFWLGRRVRARQKSIILQIPDALDLLTISVRAGLGFDAALGKVVEKMQGALVDEFRRALAEVRVARPGGTRSRHRPAHRGARPHQLHRRDHPGRAAGRLDQQGAPGPVEQLRIERRQRAEEQAAKAPIKMSSRWSAASSVALHRHPGPGDHPDHQNLGGREDGRRLGGLPSRPPLGGSAGVPAAARRAPRRPIAGDARRLRVRARNLTRDSRPRSSLEATSRSAVASWASWAGPRCPRRWALAAPGVEHPQLFMRSPSTRSSWRSPVRTVPGESGRAGRAAAVDGRRLAGPRRRRLPRAAGRDRRGDPGRCPAT